MSSISPEPGPFPLDRTSYNSLRQRVLRSDGWRASRAGRCRIWKSIINSFGAIQVKTQSKT
jgi:hypothetical protein